MDSTPAVDFGVLPETPSADEDKESDQEKDDTEQNRINNFGALPYLLVILAGSLITVYTREVVVAGITSLVVAGTVWLYVRRSSKLQLERDGVAGANSEDIECPTEDYGDAVATATTDRSPESGSSSVQDGHGMQPATSDSAPDNASESHIQEVDDISKITLSRLETIDISAAVDHLVGPPFGLPAGQGPGEFVVTELQSDSIDQLSELPERLAERKQPDALTPILLGIPQCDDGKQLEPIVDSYDTTLFIDDEYQPLLYDILEAVACCTHNSMEQELHGVGSVTFDSIPIDRLRQRVPDEQGLLQALTTLVQEHRGHPTHPYAASLRRDNRPSVTVVLLPDQFSNLVYSTLSESSPHLVLDSQRELQRIITVRFFIESSLTPDRFPTHTSTPDSDWSSLPTPPEPDTGTDPPPANPNKVVVDPTVFEEMATHALSDPEREVYGLLYEREGRIVKYHTVDSEEHVLRKPREVSFQSDFYEHVRRLANLYSEFGLRLCGDSHSHPMSGIPDPSPQDLLSFKKFWSNERNTYFIIGLNDDRRDNDSEGWEKCSNGIEVRRVIDNNLVRIQAYGVDGNNKRIKFIGEDGRSI
jgi:hypothetical protein